MVAKCITPPINLTFMFATSACIKPSGLTSSWVLYSVGLLVISPWIHKEQSSRTNRWLISISWTTFSSAIPMLRWSALTASCLPDIWNTEFLLHGSHDYLFPKCLEIYNVHSIYTLANPYDVLIYLDDTTFLSIWKNLSSVAQTTD